MTAFERYGVKKARANMRRLVVARGGVGIYEPITV